MRIKNKCEFSGFMLEELRRVRNPFTAQQQMFYSRFSHQSPEICKFALNLQSHCRPSDSCLNEGATGPRARHLCLLEKPLL